VSAAAAPLAALAFLLLASSAPAQTPGSSPTGTRSVTTAADPNALSVPASQTKPPPLHRLSARQAVAIADRVAKVRRERARFASTRRTAFTKGALQWQVSYYAAKDKEIAQVLIDDSTGAVREAWTGHHVAWTMARGYPGAFGRKINSPYLWIPLAVVFVLPFVDPRRPFRMLHLDLLVLSGFSVSLYFFNRAEIDTSVPLVYPLLAYLLVRMLAIGLRHRSDHEVEPLRLLVPASWLAMGIVFLLGFRVGLNITDSNVIDVGYAGVIGADNLVDGDALYGNFPKDNEHGDTYGPVNYAAYVPFEQAMPWSGRWDDLPAAHGAAIFFDLACMGLLWLLGRRLRGPTLGIALAFAWATYPFTAFVSNSNANDSLVAALVIGAVVVAGSPPARGALVALAGLTKFAPLALGPLFALHGRERRGLLRTGVLFALAFALVAAAALAPVLGEGDLRAFYERTMEFQAERGSPFSLWGMYGGLGTVQTAVQVAAVLLAIGAAFLPRGPRGTVSLAALAAAILIALQLGVTHWFYLYIVWFFPLVMVALLGRYGPELADGEVGRAPLAPATAPAA
jgi:hypothetical protein